MTAFIGAASGPSIMPTILKGEPMLPVLNSPAWLGGGGGTEVGGEGGGNTRRRSMRWPAKERW